MALAVLATVTVGSIPEILEFSSWTAVAFWVLAAGGGVAVYGLAARVRGRLARLPAQLPLQ